MLLIPSSQFPQDHAGAAHVLTIACYTGGKFQNDRLA